MSDPGTKPWRFPFRMIALAIAIATVIGASSQYGDLLTLENFASQESKVREFQQSNPLLIYAAALLLYVAVTGLSLPGAVPLSLVYGWFFGLLRGVLVVSFASTAGATIAFLASRYLLRDVIQSRFGERLEAFNKNLERDGAFYLFTLRLIPVVSFLVINVVMGLTPMKTQTFWWVSQIGMLPGTIVYVYAGSTFPSIDAIANSGVGGIISPQLVIAFIVLGLFPLAARMVLSRLAEQRSMPADDQEADNGS